MGTVNGLSWWAVAWIETMLCSGLSVKSTLADRRDDVCDVSDSIPIVA